MKEFISIWKKEIKMTKDELRCFLITFLAGVITYYEMPANWLTNPDTVWNSVYFRMGHGGEKVNGRLFQIIVDKLRMNMVTPVLTTIVCVLLISVTALLIGRIFESRVSVNLLTGLLLVFIPCTSSSLTYYYCADSFFLAFFLVVLGSYLIKKYFSVFSCAAAVCLFTASLYLYQAYICLAFTLALLLLILSLLKGQKIKKVLITFGHYVLTSGVAVLIYAVTFKIMQVVLRINVRTDRGLGFTDLFGEEGLAALIGQAYVNFYEYLFGNRLLNNEFGDRNLINIFIIVVMLGCILAVVIKDKYWKQPDRMLLLIVGIGLLPLAVEAITVMSPEVDKYGPTGIIMVPTFAFLYIFTVVLGDIFIKKSKFWIFRPISCVVVILFLWNSIVFTNLCINSMQMNLNKTQTVADLMFDRIVEECGYEKGAALMVAGSMEDGNFPALYEWPVQVIQGTSASYGFMWDTYTGNENCWIEFFKQYKGVSFSACGQEEYEELLKDDEYVSMPIFPEEGSVKKFGDTIVVKMSDVILE